MLNMCSRPLGTENDGPVTSEWGKIKEGSEGGRRGGGERSSLAPPGGRRGCSLLQNSQVTHSMISEGDGAALIHHRRPV